MLRVHLMQNWFGSSVPTMEEVLYQVTVLRRFAGLHLDRIPDETTILNFRRLLENTRWPVGFGGHQRLSGRTRPAAAPGQHRRCHDHSRAQFDEEQGQQSRFGGVA